MNKTGSRHPLGTLALGSTIVTMFMLIGTANPSCAQAWDQLVIDPADITGPSIHMVTFEVERDTYIEIGWNASGPLDFTVQGPDGQFFEEMSTSFSWVDLEISRGGPIEMMWSNFDLDNNVTLAYWLDDWPLLIDDIEHPEESISANVPLIIAVIICTIIFISLLFWYLSRGPRPGVHPAYAGIEGGIPGAVPTGLPYPNVGGVPIATTPQACWKCGASVGPGMLFCPGCGVAQKDHQPPPPTQPPNLKIRASTTPGPMAMKGLCHSPVAWSVAVAVLSMLMLPGMATPALGWESGDVILGPSNPSDPTTYSMFYRIDMESIIFVSWNATGPLTFNMQTPDGEMLWENATREYWTDLLVNRMGDIMLTWINFDLDNSVSLTYQIDDEPMFDVSTISVSSEESGGPGWMLIGAIVSAIVIVSLLFWFLSMSPRPGVSPVFMGAEMGSPASGPVGLPYPNVGGVPVDTAPRPCWKCGASVGPGMLYCPDCGAELREHGPPGDGS